MTSNERTLFSLLQTYPGMVPYKQQRPAGDKTQTTAIQVYQPNTTNYQQVMHVQQPFVPVSCEYAVPPPITIPIYLPENCH
jgi:muscleblind protein